MPASLAELQQAVRQAARLRVKGTGHSFNDAVATDGTLVCTDRLCRVLHTDTAARTVRVEAGMKLSALNAHLWAHGLAFPNLGDIAEQAVGGLISTGTHGSGLAWGSFSDGRSVLGVELVLADGSLLALSAARPEDAAQLAAARLGLGALGVIYAVTFQVVAAHHLQLRASVVDEAAVAAAELPRQHDHFEYFTFPFTDRVLRITRDVTAAPVTPARWAAGWHDLLVENYGLLAVLRLAALVPSQTAWFMRLIARLAGSEAYVARSYAAMASVRLVRFYETEFAFPIAAVGAALATYHRVNDFYARRRRYYASFPGEVRFLGGDQGTLLSPTLGRETAYIAVQAFPSFGPGYAAYFATMAAEFAQLDGRPHWGKLFYASPAASYPGFEAFERVRASLDPHGKFLNPYLRRVGCG